VVSRNDRQNGVPGRHFEFSVKILSLHSEGNLSQNHIFLARFLVPKQIQTLYYHIKSASVVCKYLQVKCLTFQV